MTAFEVGLPIAAALLAILTFLLTRDVERIRKDVSLESRAADFKAAGGRLLEVTRALEAGAPPRGANIAQARSDVQRAIRQIEMLEEAVRHSRTPTSSA